MGLCQNLLLSSALLMLCSVLCHSERHGPSQEEQNGFLPNQLHNAGRILFYTNTGNSSWPRFSYQKHRNPHRDSSVTRGAATHAHLGGRSWPDQPSPDLVSVGRGKADALIRAFLARKAAKLGRATEYGSPDQLSIGRGKAEAHFGAFLVRKGVKVGGTAEYGSLHPTIDRSREPTSGICSAACGKRKKSVAQRYLSSNIGRTSYVLALDGSFSVSQLLMGSSFELQDGLAEVLDDSRESLDYKEEHSPDKPYKFKYIICPPSMRDFISCEESFSGKSMPCESAVGDQHCIVDIPGDYMRPPPWPQSRDQVSAQNIPLVPLLKSNDAPLLVKNDRGFIRFYEMSIKPGQTIGAYVENLQKLVPSMEFGKRTRVVLDVNGRTGSFSAELAKQEVLTLTIAEKESALNGVQLLLERGLPGLVQTFSTYHLPYPEQAFDLLHCADCGVSWLANDGLLLVQADRLVRSGGFIILVNSSSNENDLAGIMRLTANMSWELAAREGDLMIWQKGLGKKDFASPQCTADFEAVVKRWPIRLTVPPLRLHCIPMAGIQSAKEEMYLADFNYWSYLTSFYLSTFGASRIKDIRNVIDMNAGYGGFAASLSLDKLSQHWWVLNVVPVTAPDRLSVVFDRGLLGIYHDWCKPLDVYPRTFDMLHASMLFSTCYRCNMSDILLEMDRLLRPGGYALVRDRKDTIAEVEALAKLLSWKTTVHDTESGVKGTDKLLHCQKSFHARKMRNRSQ